MAGIGNHGPYPGVRVRYAQIRAQPEKYVGTRDHAPYQIVEQLFAPSLLGFFDGRTTTVDIRVEGDWLVFEDDGPGLETSVDVGDGPGFGELASWAGPYQRNDGSRGGRVVITPGRLAMRALAAELEVESRRDGRASACRYVNGAVDDAPHIVGPASRGGVRFRWRPDEAMLGRVVWNRDRLVAIARDRAALAAGLAVTVDGKRLHYPRGLLDYASELDGAFEPVHGRFEQSGIAVEFAIAWGLAPAIRGFACWERAPAGKHVTGVVMGFGTVIGDRVPKYRLLGVSSFEAMLRSAGIHAIVHVEAIGLPWTMEHTGEGPDVGTLVRGAVSGKLEAHFDREPGALDSLLIALDRVAT